MHASMRVLVMPPCLCSSVRHACAPHGVVWTGRGPARAQELLEACGRAHSLADVYRAIDAVAAAGVSSWSLDLMSGLPGLAMGAWRASLAEAVRAAPSHISVYDLQVSGAGGGGGRGACRGAAAM